MLKGSPMVKNRAVKRAARELQSEQGMNYPRALAQVQDTRFAGFVLGADGGGNSLFWTGQAKGRSLSVQGTAGSGKTTLVRTLAAQAAGHFDVFACLSGGDPIAEATDCSTNTDGTWDLLRTIRDAVASSLAKAQAYAPAPPQPGVKANRLAGLFRQPVGVDVLPEGQRPRPSIVFIDDFDSLCRGWEWNNGELKDIGGPGTLVSNLVRDSRRAGLTVVVTGRSLPSRRGHDLAHGEKLLLGPATLAEREAFLFSDVADMEIGSREGILDSIITGHQLVHFPKR